MVRAAIVGGSDAGRNRISHPLRSGPACNPPQWLSKFWPPLAECATDSGFRWRVDRRSADPALRPASPRLNHGRLSSRSFRLIAPCWRARRGHRQRPDSDFRIRTPVRPGGTVCAGPLVSPARSPRGQGPYAAVRHRFATQLSRRGLIGLLGRPRGSSKSGTDARRPKLLICLAGLGWVPNRPSEQPQRKSGGGDRFGAASASSRCTALLKKWPNPSAFPG
jgi:hypothetical protein